MTQILLLLIPLFFYCLSGVIDAVMDTLKNHYTTSIFKDKDPQFWNPNVSWTNKYIDGDVNKGHKKITILGFSFNYPDALTDAWHILKIIREFSIVISITSGGWIGFNFSFIWLLVYFGLLGIIRNNCFSLFWDKILKA